MTRKSKLQVDKYVELVQIHKTENRLTQLGGSGPGSFSSVKTRNTYKIT